jgi:hypothetical protein
MYCKSCHVQAELCVWHKIENIESFQGWNFRGLCGISELIDKKRPFFSVTYYCAPHEEVKLSVMHGLWTPGHGEEDKKIYRLGFKLIELDFQ